MVESMTMAMYPYSIHQKKEIILPKLKIKRKKKLKEEIINDVNSEQSEEEANMLKMFIKMRKELAGKVGNIVDDNL